MQLWQVRKGTPIEAAVHTVARVYVTMKIILDTNNLDGVTD